MPRTSLLEQAFRSPAGRAVARKAGLAEPPRLRRGRTRATGPVVLASLGGGSLAAETLRALGVETAAPLLDLPGNRTKDDRGRDQPPAYGVRPGAGVVDATALATIAELEGLRQVLRPAMRALEKSGRVIIVATEPAALDSTEGRAVAQAIDGFTRTVAKELRGGATANLVLTGEGVGVADLRTTLAFLLDGRSAFVSGQAWRVGPAAASPTVADPARPFTGRVVVVTGAARGIGAEIARVFSRDGADVVAVDVPAAGDALAKVANEVRGSALQLDITAADAGGRIADHVIRVHGPRARTWAVVHNAGLTRDRMLANLDEGAWASVLEVNLAAQLRLNEVLLDAALPGGLDEAGRIIAVSSTSGIAGNKGQANYAASKAGVLGLVRAEAAALAGRPVTVNAVAPGFIETEMTARIPFVQREVFRRVNSLGQGGLPVDVAEAIAYLADPGSGGVTGQVLRVCGQNLVGA